MTKIQEPTAGKIVNGTKRVQRAVEVDEAEIRGVRLTLLIAYLLTLTAFVAIVWARGELIDWIAE